MCAMIGLFVVGYGWAGGQEEGGEVVSGEVYTRGAEEGRAFEGRSDTEAVLSSALDEDTKGKICVYISGRAGAGKSSALPASTRMGATCGPLLLMFLLLEAGCRTTPTLVFSNQLIEM